MNIKLQDSLLKYRIISNLNLDLHECRT